MFPTLEFEEFNWNLVFGEVVRVLPLILKDLVLIGLIDLNFNFKFILRHPKILQNYKKNIHTSIFVIFESISDGFCDEKINGKRKHTIFSFKERAIKFQYQTAESYFVFPQTFPTEYFPLLVFLYFQLNARMIFHLSLFFISDIQIYFYFLSKRRNS